MDRQAFEEIMGEDACATVQRLRAEAPRPVADLDGVLEGVERAVVATLPVVPAAAPFVAPSAGLVQAGNPSPSLVRSVLNLVDRARAAVRSTITSTLAEAQADTGALTRTELDASTPAAARTVTSGQAVALATEATANHGRELVRAAIEGARKDRESLGRFGKFVSDGAIVAPQGGAKGIGPVSSFAARLAAVGAIAGMAITIPHAPAYADWYGKQRRSEGRRAAIAAGVGIVAGVLAGKALAGQGFSSGQSYGYVPPTPYVPPRSYGYDSYGGVAPMQAYAPRVTLPSDNFILAAKTVVAARIGSVRGADDSIDRALIAGRSCVQEMGPNPRCTVRVNGVVLDFANARYVATDLGRPVIAETNGMIQRLQPQALQEAFFRAKEIKQREDYAGGYGGGYGAGYGNYPRY